MKASKLGSWRLSFVMGAALGVAVVVVVTDSRPVLAQGSGSAHAAGLEHASLTASGLDPGFQAQLAHVSRSNLKLYMRAAQAFPAFCKDWGRKLRDREVNNLNNLTFQLKNGWQTGTYISYSDIKTCNCKITDGFPIGELTYQETQYYLAGHTVEEARHAKPKPISVTNTTEIFRWDKTKWDY